MILTKIFRNIKVKKKINNFKVFNYSLKSLVVLKKKQVKKINEYKKVINYSQEIKQNPINYILTLSISQTNTLINLSKTNGDVIIFLSSGFLNLKKRQKTLQPLALINLLKSIFLIGNFKFNEVIAVHFRNVKPQYEHLIINLLKKVIFISSIKSSNLQPHNGCRPKKFKKFKKRTKSKKKE